MNGKTRKLINDLEEVRLQLFRSAANLDDVISRITVDTLYKDDVDDKYLEFILKNYGSYRNDYRKAIGDLNKLESDVWESLVKSVSGNESQ